MLAESVPSSSAPRAAHPVPGPAALRVTLPIAILIAIAAAGGPAAAAEPDPATGAADGVGSVARAAAGAPDPDAPARRLHARTAWHWPYAAGPVYSDAGRAPAREPGRRPAGLLVSPVGLFDLRSGPLPFPAELRAPDDDTARYALIQMHPDLAAEHGADLVRKLREAGADVAERIPVETILVRMTPEAWPAARGALGVLAAIPFHPALKLDPRIGRLPHPDPRRAVSEVYRLEALLMPGADPAAAAAAVRAAGATGLRIFDDALRFDLHRDRLAAAARVDAIRQIHEWFPPTLHGEETTTLVQAGPLTGRATPFHDAGVDGSGAGLPGTAPQVLMILDSGIQIDAADLSDTRSSAGTPGPAHRKVRAYLSTGGFGGSGDGLGCDAGAQGGVTHGHLVAATALGNATDVDTATYGAGWQVEDPNNPGNFYDVDGVAPGAVLVAYDAQVTPAVGNCGDPLQGVFDVGELYAAPSGGSLADAYDTYGARVFNFSWGVDVNIYDANAQDVDTFLSDGDRPDALVVVSIGNAGSDVNADQIPDPQSVGAPATAKNAIVVGASGHLDDQGSPFNVNERAPFSSVGPAGTSGRTVPLLMAPGQERGFSGIDSEFGCRSSDNDQVDPVQCDLVSGAAGTSFSAPAAAGAAMLVRDWFAQGFFPDGTSSNPGNAADQVDVAGGALSGAAVKAVLITSAEMIGRNFTGQGGLDNLTRRFRFNREQGYGRIQLERALPLANWPDSPTALAIADGAAAGGPNNLGLAGQVEPAGAGATDASTFDVCDPDQEIRIALAWMDPTADALANDLDLTLIAPGGREYWGNYFTDDNNRNGVNTPLEDCPGFGGESGTLQATPWSLPVCERSIRDVTNPTEGIFLSPDPDGDGDSDDGRSQIEIGTWQIRVEHRGGAGASTQPYALVVGGGLCQGSSVRLDANDYVCNDAVRVRVTESEDPDDPAQPPGVAQAAARTTLQTVGYDVCDDGETSCVDASDCTGIGSGVCNAERVFDEESGLAFAQPAAPALQFVSDSVLLTDRTAFDPGNGALDVRDGMRIRVLYADEGAGGASADLLRSNSAAVDCTVDLEFGSIRFGQFGQNTTYDVVGGCERSARGLFEFGFPDLYMDAGETVGYRFAFASDERETLREVEADLRCVRVDADSPPDCLPGSDTCADPDRENNPPCSGLLSVLDTPRTIGRIPPGGAISSNFMVAVDPGVTGTPKVEMILRISGDVSGKTVGAVAVNRHVLNVDEVSLFYSTDFPTGGTEPYDVNNNDFLETPTRAPGDLDGDYVFELRTWSDLTDGGTRNLGLQSPWNFDTGDGGFRSGLNSATDDQTITDIMAQWGEDKDFNGVLSGRCVEGPSVACTRFPTDPISCPANLDPGSSTFDFNCTNLEDRDPTNSPIPLLDQNWSTEGGCGWQTRAPGTCSGDPSRGCYEDAQCAGVGSCSGPAPVAGGIWHTGRISDRSSSETNPNNCGFQGNNVSQGDCQFFETISGASGLRLWFETLLTPVIEKVNLDLDADGDPLYRAEITQWAWNQAIDLPDSLVGMSWEFDTDTEKLEPSDLVSDLDVLNLTLGPFGPVTDAGNAQLAGGFSMFAPLREDSGQSYNGVAGNDRHGDNSCFFEGAGKISTLALATLGFAGPPDDDAVNGYCDFGDGSLETSCTWVCAQRDNVACTVTGDCAGMCQPNNRCSNDGTKICSSNAQCNFGACADASPVCDGASCIRDSADSADIDRYVMPNGPIRNMDIRAFNGPDMRFSTLEDLYRASPAEQRRALAPVGRRPGPTRR